MTLQGKSWLIGTTLLAAVLRFKALFANRFHADEALFATWARLIAVGRDLLLQGQPIDKPPLQFYLQALFYPLLGPVEWAARFPGLIASMLLVPLVGVLVWRLSGDELAAILAAALVTMSPLAIQFSGTAFTDPLLALLLVASFYFACSPFSVSSAGEASGPRSCLTSGVLFGLAAATKHQAWLFLPLLLGTGLLAGWRKRQWRPWLTGLFVPVLAVLAWELARTGTFSLWSSQLSNYGGIRPIYSWELWPRLQDWLSLWRFVVAISLLFLAIPFRLLVARRGERDNPVFWLILLYLLAYFWFHWIFAIPIWDRYLLPAVPLAAILLGLTLGPLLGQTLARNLFGRGRQSGFPRVALTKLSALIVALLLVLQLPAAVAARDGRFPIGGLPTADQGAAAVAEQLLESPYGTVLYDHWYSWHWRYHLFDKRVFVHWFPHPEALIEDLHAFGYDGNQRFIALPKSDLARPVRRAVVDAGFQLQAVDHSVGSQIVLFQILPQDVDS